MKEALSKALAIDVDASTDRILAASFWLRATNAAGTVRRLADVVDLAERRAARARFV